MSCVLQNVKSKAVVDIKTLLSGALRSGMLCILSPPTTTSYLLYLHVE